MEQHFSAQFVYIVKCITLFKKLEVFFWGGGGGGKAETNTEKTLTSSLDLVVVHMCVCYFLNSLYVEIFHSL